MPTAKRCFRQAGFKATGREVHQGGKSRTNDFINGALSEMSPTCRTIQKAPDREDLAEALTSCLLW